MRLSISGGRDNYVMVSIRAQYIETCMHRSFRLLWSLNIFPSPLASTSLQIVCDNGCLV